MRPTRRILPVLVALLLAIALPATAATPSQRYEKSAHAATNKIRAGHDLATLRTNACLQKWARSWAAVLAKRGELGDADEAHQPARPVMRDCGLSWYGENVAMGYRSGKSVVREGWMRSSGHRANILKREYRLMGIGAKKADGVWFVAQVFGRK